MLERANLNQPKTKEEKEAMIREAAYHYELFMRALGWDISQDPHSKDTPIRVAKSFVNDLCKGCWDEEPPITSFEDETQYDGMVFSGGIDVKSLCSHHHLPFWGSAFVAYIPDPENHGKIIGLSKLNRIVDFYSRRPQVQESLTMQIHKHLDSLLGSNKGVMVLIKAHHSCCSYRGIKQNSIMQTAKPSGLFEADREGVKKEFYQNVTNHFNDLRP